MREQEEVGNVSNLGAGIPTEIPFATYKSWPPNGPVFLNRRGVFLFFSILLGGSKDLSI